MHRPGAFENRNKKRPALGQAGYSQQPCLVEKISPYYFCGTDFHGDYPRLPFLPTETYGFRHIHSKPCFLPGHSENADDRLFQRPALVGRARTRQPGSAPAFRRLPDSLARLIQAPSPSQCKRGRFIQVRLHMPRHLD